MLTGMNTGIYKMLAFGADGSLSVFHNDSTMQYGELHVYFFSALIPQILEEKKSYQIKTESAGCYNAQISFLVVDSAQNYQYNVSNDTLYISNPPCLAPVSSVYLKVE